MTPPIITSGRVSQWHREDSTEAVDLANGDVEQAWRAVTRVAQTGEVLLTGNGEGSTFLG